MVFKSNKLISFSFILITVLNYLNAQNNLNFNQVLLIPSGTVPQDKTWKLEGIIFTSAPQNLNTGNINEVSSIKINGTLYTARKFSSYQYFSSGGNGQSQSSMNYIWEMKFPIWLPAGTSLESSSGVSLFSILEFSVTSP